MKSKQKNDLHQRTVTELKTLLSEALKLKNTLKVNLQNEKNQRVYKTKRQEIAIIKSLIREFNQRKRIGGL